MFVKAFLDKYRSGDAPDFIKEDGALLESGLFKTING